MKLIINADGASRGNPGPAAIGATVKDEKGRLFAAISERIGRTTNNQAEYRALLAAIKEAVRLGATEVAIRLDSELLVRQLTGRYRVKHPALRPLYEETRSLLARLAGFTIAHIPREENAEADRLANVALDQP
jgi:ribonuclease HI